MKTKKLLIMGGLTASLDNRGSQYAAIAQAPTETHETMHVNVIGSNPEWTKISEVAANTLIRVRFCAVNFGPPF